MEETFKRYIKEINKAYQKGDSTEHTHRPALQQLIQLLDNKITATNEPRRIKCGAPDFSVSRKSRNTYTTIGYIEAKDINVSLSKTEKTEQLKKRYLPSLHNLILTDYNEFRLYIDGEKKMEAKLADERAGKFEINSRGAEELENLLKTFLDQNPVKIKIASRLAEKMAHKARMLSDIINRTFQQEDSEGSLHSQYEAFKDVLIHDLSIEQFSDMYAQTISYGLFTARCYIDDVNLFEKDKYAVFHGMDERPKELTRKEAAYLLPKTNPFLRKMFNYIAGPELDDRIAWLVEDLITLLQNADMGTILRDFAKQNTRNDPVIHFYETFLAEYNPSLRKSRGVYYTPESVVSYITRSVDYILKDTFGLKQGLADNSKTRIPTRDGKEIDAHKCLILDPAAGTGTFLHEVVQRIYDKFSKDKGMWSGYVQKHLLPRIFGFELMMAPYAVAHMKLGLQLAETGYNFDSEERLKIFLTNTLEEAEEISKTLFAQWLSEEARAANEVKRDLPIMVVLGNPPYSGLSANMNDWIQDLIKQKLPGKNGSQSYYEVDGKPLGERKTWLQDDYVKFIRYGQYRIEQNGVGVLGFITNHAYLDNPTFRGMRQSLMNTFSKIYILDLHGNSKKKETCPDGAKDENVFDIQQGVSIALFVKEPDSDKPAEIHHCDLWGVRKNKYEWLLENDIKSTQWQTITPNSPYYFFIPKEESKRKEYEEYIKINEIMPTNVTGIVTARDGLVIDFSEKELLQKIRKFRDTQKSDSEIRELFFPSKSSKKYLPGDTRGWKVADARKKLQKDTAWREKAEYILYRPFDIRSIYYTNDMVDWSREKLMGHMLAGENVGLIVSRQIITEFKHVFVSRNIINFNSIATAGRFGSGPLFPLYLYPDNEKKDLFEQREWDAGRDGRVPNLDNDFVDKLAGGLKLEFVTDGKGDLKKTFGPEDIFYYIYAIFHSPSYRKRYAEFLKYDFPRVPLTKSKVLFRKLSQTGEHLAKLHLLEAEELEDTNNQPVYPKEGSNVIEKGYPKFVADSDKPDKGRVYINKAQYFEGVRPDVWEFYVGGYQVCHKWLKDRKNRELSFDDISHYKNITAALAETIKLMDEIDEIIESRSGWPLE